MGESDIRTAAKTLISMCADFLENGISEKTFRTNLGLFGDTYREMLEEKDNEDSSNASR